MDGSPSDEAERRKRLLQQAVEHPVRRNILRRLRPSGTTVTASELASSDLPLSYANYHLTYLEEVGAVEVAETMHEGNKVIRVFRSTPAGQRCAAR